MLPHQHAFLAQYLATLSETERQQIPDMIAEHFCADKYHANECARLINAGQKRATCSLKAAYDSEHEPLPQVGRLTVVLDWAQNPVCIIRITHVEACPFNQVSPEFVALEGEGDGSYAWWRQAHLAFFLEYADNIGTKFTERSELLLEYFEKVFPLA